MRLVQTEVRFPLASVKPLERLLDYRNQCLALTHQALEGSRTRRTISPVGGASLEPWDHVDGLEYVRCPESGSLFLSQLPDCKRWADLLAQVSRTRNFPEGFHRELASSRADNVYLPRLEWIQQALRLQGIDRPRLLEVTTSPSDFSQWLRQCDLFSQVLTVDEMALTHAASSIPLETGQVAVLMESLDRVDDPAGLVQEVAHRLQVGGLLFATGLVCSGFDMTVLGSRNLYLYPPDRTNCFSLLGLKRLLEQAGLHLLEVSTPGVLDVEIVEAHHRLDPSLALSGFERQILQADGQTRQAFQAFLQESGLSSFVRIVARKRS